ncbi:MAG: TerC family protein [Armatimonadota bacterium]
MNLSSLLDFSWMSQPSAWIGLATLVLLEIVLGIDNIVFVSILAGKLPKDQQARGRSTGMVLAVIPRILLLLALPLVLALAEPVVRLPFRDPDPLAKAGTLGLSVQDLIVLIGGCFLIAKATHEIHHKLEGADHLETNPADRKAGAGAIGAVMVQIMVLNIVFSLDSIITAVGMIPKEQILVMVLAVLISTAVMYFSVGPVAGFVERHPTVKMLALAFLILIGTTLVIEGLHFHLPKGYVYFAMGFSVFVEVLNLRATKRSHGKPVQLHEPKL